MPKKNSIQSWILATRPKTLSGAIVPVLVGGATAWRATQGDISFTYNWVAILLCMLFAMTMQINANLVNDYYDCIRGIDGENRLGPKRACAQGWVSLPAMRWAIFISIAVATVIGAPLALWGGPWMLAVGALCVLFSFLYTTCLARMAMGDILVLVFFGLVPVCIPYYIQAGTIPPQLWRYGLACGLVTECLLLVNNYRDRDTDLGCGKRTLVTYIGPVATEWFFLFCGLAAVALCHPLRLPYIYIIPHILLWWRMRRINHGARLNQVLAMTGASILLFGILVSVGI